MRGSAKFIAPEVHEQRTMQKKRGLYVHHWRNGESPLACRRAAC